VPQEQVPEETAPSVALPLVNFRVNKTGLYQITYEQLAAAGFDLAGVQSYDLALINRGQPIHIHMVSAKHFGPGAYFQFYGQALDTLYTDTNIYSLYVNAAQVKRVGLNVTKPPKGATPVPYYMETVEIDKNVRYGF